MSRKTLARKAFEQHDGRIRRMARLSAPHHLVDDFYGEGLIVLMRCVNKYIVGRPKKHRPTDKEFEKIISRSVKNRFRDLIHEEQKKATLLADQGIRLVSLDESVPGDVHTGQVGPDHGVRDERMSLIMDDPIYMDLVKDAVRRLAAAVEQRLPPEGMEVLRHMMWSDRVRFEVYKTFSRRLHLRKRGMTSYINEDVQGNPGSPVPIRFIVQAMDGMFDRSHIERLVTRIRRLARKEWRAIGLEPNTLQFIMTEW